MVGPISASLRLGSKAPFEEMLQQLAALCPTLLTRDLNLRPKLLLHPKGK